MVLHYVAVSAEESDIGRQTVWLKQARKPSHYDYYNVSIVDGVVITDS